MLTLKKANIDDMQQYFDWANDKVVRQNAFNQEIVDWETHQKWFQDRLNDKNSFLYVAENNQDKIGQVRFDCKNNRATIHYSIFSDFRGLGFGKKIVENSIKQIKKDCLGVKIIEAKVKKNNIPSNKIFLKLDFEIQNKEGQVITYQLVQR